MSEVRRELQEMLARPIRDPEDAERAARAAQALAEYIRAENHAHAVLDPSRVSSRRSPDGGDLDHLSLHQAAERVLEEAGIPLHVKELGQRIKAGGWTHKRSAHARPDQINYQLAARLPRHPKTFVRVAPNTFGLTKWGKGVAARQPLIGLFRSGSKDASVRIGEHPEEVFEDA